MKIKFVIYIILTIGLIWICNLSFGSNLNQSSSGKSWEYLMLYYNGISKGYYIDTSEKIKIPLRDSKSAFDEIHDGIIALNILGKEGWELTEIEGSYFYFRRLKNKNH